MSNDQNYTRDIIILTSTTASNYVYMWLETLSDSSQAGNHYENALTLICSYDPLRLPDMGDIEDFLNNSKALSFRIETIVSSVPYA